MRHCEALWGGKNGGKKRWVKEMVIFVCVFTCEYMEVCVSYCNYSGQRQHINALTLTCLAETYMPHCRI